MRIQKAPDVFREPTSISAERVHVVDCETYHDCAGKEAERVPRLQVTVPPHFKAFQLRKMPFVDLPHKAGIRRHLINVATIVSFFDIFHLLIPHVHPLWGVLGLIGTCRIFTTLAQNVHFVNCLYWS
mgnify:CR=1 FL=1